MTVTFEIAISVLVSITILIVVVTTLSVCYKIKDYIECSIYLVILLICLWISFLDSITYGEKLDIQDQFFTTIDIEEVGKTYVVYGKGQQGKKIFLDNDNVEILLGTENVIDVIDRTYNVDWLFVFNIKLTDIAYRIYLEKPIYNKITENILYKRETK